MMEGSLADDRGASRSIRRLININHQTNSTDPSDVLCRPEPSAARESGRCSLAHNIESTCKACSLSYIHVLNVFTDSMLRRLCSSARSAVSRTTNPLLRRILLRKGSSAAYRRTCALPLIDALTRGRGAFGARPVEKAPMEVIYANIGNRNKLICRCGPSLPQNELIRPTTQCLQQAASMPTTLILQVCLLILQSISIPRNTCVFQLNGGLQS